MVYLLPAKAGFFSVFGQNFQNSNAKKFLQRNYSDAVIGAPNLEFTFMVVLAQWLERRSVEAKAAGSTPVYHPNEKQN